MKGHVTSIHFLRAFAAAAVVAHHIPIYLAGRVSFALLTFEHGAAGVDLFFIISGFVMHRATSGRRVGWYEFLAKRSIRVLPMYWLVTLALAAAVWLVPFAFSTFTVSGADLIKSLLFMPVFSNDGSIRPVVAVGWTLYFEMMFYLVVAGWLVVRDRTACSWAALTMLALAALGQLLGLSQPYSAFQLWSPIIVEFAGGVLLSQWLQTSRIWAVAPALRVAIAIVSTAVGLLAISLQSSNALVMARVASWGIGSLLIVAGFLCIEPELSRASRLRMLLDPLGSASYALYLLHGMAFSIVWKLTPGLLRAQPLAACFALFAGPIIAALVVHRVLEVPLMRWLAGWFDRVLEPQIAPAPIKTAP